MTEAKHMLSISQGAIRAPSASLILHFTVLGQDWSNLDLPIFSFQPMQTEREFPLATVSLASRALPVSQRFVSSWYGDNYSHWPGHVVLWTIILNAMVVV